MAKIELGPWMHDIKSGWHKKVIDYIRNLPEGSNVALEISPGHLKSLIKSLQLPSPSSSSKLVIPSTDTSEHILSLFNDDSFLPIIDVLNECRKRRIRVVPIESEPLYNVVSKDDIDNIQFQRLNLAREVHFTRMIDRFTREHGESVYVITGASHTVIIMDMLDRLGHNAYVTSKIFESEAERDKFVKDYHISRYTGLVNSDKTTYSLNRLRDDNIQKVKEALLFDILSGKLTTESIRYSEPKLELPKVHTETPIKRINLIREEPHRKEV